MNDTITRWMTKTYDRTARRYRLDDELHVTGEDHRRIHDLLTGICAQFNHPISALDLGCGTGRHFHCLSNVKHLIGVDVSSEMLKEAENPVRASEIQVQKIELRCSDLSELSFPENSFELIMSFGVFGNGASLSRSLMAQLYHWLTPGGVLVLDTFDPESLPPIRRLRKFLRWRLHSMLPRSLQAAWIKATGWPPIFFCSSGELTRLLRSVGFQSFSLERVSCHLPEGPGLKLQIVATKDPLPQTAWFLDVFSG